ncbi:MAG: sugar ABC transporter permease [Lachnospiraceae bacterium]|nr:sugar ABC transporter permease [Lachnospiraceae bacterium]
MGEKTKKKRTVYQYSARNALCRGNWITRLSLVVFGLGCLVRGQIIKGCLFLLSEAAIIFYMVRTGFHNLSMLITLGELEQQKVWNEAKSVYEYVDGDRSLNILLYGIVTAAVLIAFVLIAVQSVKQAYKLQEKKEQGKHVPTFREDLGNLLNNNLHLTLLSFPVIGILAFTILPLIFMICMAFTNYSVEGNKLVLFDWVGLENFKRIVNFGGTLGQTFWAVLRWTLIWAVVATFTNYILGMLLALLINWKETRLKKMWRFFFVLTVAVPHFVTLLVIQQMLQPEGAVNVLLRNWGIIGASESLPFFTNTLWARVTVIIINVWVGVPYGLLQMTGILQNIPEEQYEAARIDGASSFVIFRKITLPYMLFVTTPYLITTFTGNVNNFNVIFLTSGGLPRALGSTAGDTDLLVTWLYKLTIDNKYYNVGAVIGIMTFLVLSVVSLLTFRLSASNRNEEEFR